MIENPLYVLVVIGDGAGKSRRHWQIWISRVSNPALGVLILVGVWHSGKLDISSIWKQSFHILEVFRSPFISAGPGPVGYISTRLVKKAFNTGSRPDVMGALYIALLESTLAWTRDIIALNGYSHEYFELYPLKESILTIAVRGSVGRATCIGTVCVR